eukprot:Cvel_3048.t1-p1 / transcript=Cvel_3048.t1 / gene=Cvel_3048 / organism=Chromera_velia_CCMP2878 / gene_product=Circumsporozoite protein, putative / transcript_product=Circumsporozoite protein, putative / location=Cvel_scaffold122:1-2647(-) / protein_length=597 / sequence_SO=supercontig / SO=protein_coding / is_pseudo=false
MKAKSRWESRRVRRVDANWDCGTRKLFVKTQKRPLIPTRVLVIENSGSWWEILDAIYRGAHDNEVACLVLGGVPWCVDEDWVQELGRHLRLFRHCGKKVFAVLGAVGQVAHPFVFQHCDKVWYTTDNDGLRWSGRAFVQEYKNSTFAKLGVSVARFSVDPFKSLGENSVLNEPSESRLTSLLYTEKRRIDNDEQRWTSTFNRTAEELRELLESAPVSIRELQQRGFLSKAHASSLEWPSLFSSMELLRTRLDREMLFTPWQLLPDLFNRSEEITLCPSQYNDTVIDVEQFLGSRAIPVWRPEVDEAEEQEAMAREVEVSHPAFLEDIRKNRSWTGGSRGKDTSASVLDMGIGPEGGVTNRWTVLGGRSGISELRRRGFRSSFFSFGEKDKRMGPRVRQGFSELQWISSSEYARQTNKLVSWKRSKVRTAAEKEEKEKDTEKEKDKEREKENKKREGWLRFWGSKREKKIEGNKGGNTTEVGAGGKHETVAEKGSGNATEVAAGEKNETIAEEGSGNATEVAAGGKNETIAEEGSGNATEVAAGEKNETIAEEGSGNATEVAAGGKNETIAEEGSGNATEVAAGGKNETIAEEGSGNA